MAIEWTPEEVKKQLPDITIALLGKAHVARLSMCSARVATATITKGPRALEQYEFPWERIADALNTNSALAPIR